MWFALRKARLCIALQSFRPSVYPSDNLSVV